MVYVASIITPKSTPILTPVRTTLKATSGVLYQFEIEFAPGCAGLVGVKVWNANTALFPIERDEWFITDRNTIKFDDVQELKTYRNELDIFTYNIDDVWQHFVQVRIGIASPLQYEERFAPGLAIKKMNDSFSSLMPKLTPDEFHADQTVIRQLSETEVNGE